MARRSNKTAIRLLELADAVEMLELRRRNEMFLKPFEPTRPPGYLTLEAQRREIEYGIQARLSDRGYAFAILAVPGDRLIGRIALSNVVRGAWQSATLGYFVGEEANGKGHCSEAVDLVLDFAFSEIGLHRIQAAVMPRNEASARVLARNGFRFEGFAPDFLRIDGRWEDHHVYAITAERWGEALRGQSSSGL
jgi:[ribosomal protein S5]-alanine N-acetyltransferase